MLATFRGRIAHPHGLVRSVWAACALLLAAAPLSLGAADPASRIVNFSTRAAAGTGDQTVILGFGVSRDADGILVRAVGPTLQSFGVTKALADPRLTVFSNRGLLTRNDDWTAAAVAPATGAYPLTAGSKDAALLAPFSQGLYTAHVTAPAGAEGIVLAELYDAQTATTARLTNVSARAYAGRGDSSFIAGLTIDGGAPRTVLLRAGGPALRAHGIANPLTDPKLELFETGAAGPFAISDNWSGSAILRTAIEQSGAAPFATDSKDAALLLTLGPGSYTARVSGADNTEGVALFEVFDNPITKFPLTSATNVVYQHGDVIKYSASGAYEYEDGSSVVVNDGWLRLEILDEGVTNPLNGNRPVMSLVEIQLYIGEFISASGASTPVRVLGFPTTRYYVQDAPGSILYQGEKLPEGVEADGAPHYNTYWFSTPKDYVQYQAPFTLGANKVTSYTKQAVVGTTTRLGRTVTDVEATETVTVPLGKFDTYRVRLVETNQNPGAEGTVLASRAQNIYPDIGIVKFNFLPTAPGDTGALVMGLSHTNLPYLGNPTHKLENGNFLRNVKPGQVTKFGRTGYYISSDGTVEEISGWFTMEVFDEGVINPLTKKPALTLLETHHTEIEATTLAGEVTHSTQHQAFKRYIVLNEIGQTAFSGDTGPDGSPVWFDRAFVPLTFPYSVGQTKSEEVSAYTVTNGQSALAFSYTPTMKILSVVPIRTPLGTFECYRMDYQDTNGYRAEQYDYPAIGAVRFGYPAPAGKQGHMELTLSSINYALP